MLTYVYADVNPEVPETAQFPLKMKQVTATRSQTALFISLKSTANKSAASLQAFKGASIDVLQVSQSALGIIYLFHSLSK